jgi:hypothetical protein
MCAKQTNRLSGGANPGESRKANYYMDVYPIDDIKWL